MRTPRASLLPSVLWVSFLLTACSAQPTPRWEADSGRALPRQAHLRISGEAQEHSLSCESRSATDLLAAYGIVLEEDAFRAGLPVSENPDLGFVGNVDGPGEQLPPAGYGVHAGPIAERLIHLGLPVSAERGRDLVWLRRQVAEGKPVIIWATGQLDAPAAVTMRDSSGRSFRVVRGEHTFLVVGYEAGLLVLVDAASGREKRVFDRGFDASWATLGRMAVVPHKPPPRAAGR